MRITTFTIFNQLVRSVNDNLRSLSKSNNELSTGKKINNPSDDVSGMMKVMDYKVSINEIEQYKRNIDEAEAHLGFADTTMSTVTAVLDKARELAVLGASGAAERDKAASEVAQLRDQLTSLANSKFRNKYIFSGYATDTQSFDAGFIYQGDSGEINVMTDSSATVAMNIPGDQVFSSGGDTYMKTLDNFYNALMDPDSEPADISAFIDEFENALDQVANVRADIGGRLNNLEDRKSNLEDRNFTLKTYLSEVEDTDLASTISEISKTEVALQSLRQSGAQVLSQSLLDFLK
jgi:flagellar hook-associated protein 3 FlgL